MSSIPNSSETSGHLASSQDKPALGEYRNENTYSFTPSGAESQSQNIIPTIKPCHIGSEHDQGTHVFPPPFVQQGPFQTDNKENSIAPTPCFPTLPGQSNFTDTSFSHRDFEYEKVKLSKEEPSKVGGILINPSDMLPSAQTEGQLSKGGDYHYQMLHSSNPTNIEASLPKETTGFAEREFEYTLERSTEHDKAKGAPKELQESSKIGGIIINPSDMLPSRQTEGQWSKGGDYHYQMLHDIAPNNTEASLSKGASDKGGFAEREFEYTMERSTQHENEKGSEKEKVPNKGKWASRAFSYGGSKDSTANYTTREFEYEHKRPSQGAEHVKPGGIVINPEDALPGKRQNIQQDSHHQFTYELLGQGHNASNTHEGERHLTSSNPSQDHSSRNTLEREVRSRMETKEPKKFGGIVLNPEDALPENRQHIQQDSHHQFTYELLGQGHSASNTHGGQKYSTRTFEYEHTRPSQDVEHVKPGGIIISPEDALPGKRQNIQQDSHHQFTYELLGQGHSASNTHGSQKYSTRAFEYEHTRPSQDVEHVKPGGIIINPEDALPGKRQNIQQDSHHQFTYELLGQGHNASNTHEGERHLTSSYPSQDHSSRNSLEREVRPRMEAKEPKKFGGVVINPEDALPENRQHIQQDSHHQFTYELLGQGHSASNTHGGQKYSTRTFEYEHTRPSQGVEHVKPGGIVINHEDALPGKRQNIQQDSHHQFTYELLGQGHSASNTHGSQKYSTRAFEYEHTRPSQDVEHVKPGGIIINPEDALPGKRQNIQQDSHHQFTYELLGQGHSASNTHGTERHLASSNPSQDHSSRNTLEREIRSRMEPKKFGGVLINPEDALPSRAGELRNVTGHTGGDNYYYAPAGVREGHILNLDKASTEKNEDDFLANFQKISSEIKLISEPSSGADLKPSTWISNPVVSERLQERNEPFKSTNSKPYQFKDDAFLSVKNVVSEDFALNQKKFDKENVSYGNSVKGYNTNVTSKYGLPIKEGGYDSIYSKPSDFGIQGQSANALTRTSLTDLNAPFDDVWNKSKNVMSYSSIEATPSYGYSSEQNNAGLKSGQSYNFSSMTSNYANFNATSNSTVFERTGGLYDLNIGGDYKHNF